jgi:hypothetical protein
MFLVSLGNICRIKAGKRESALNNSKIAQGAGALPAMPQVSLPTVHPPQSLSQPLADKRTHRRTMLVGLALCAAFVAVCLFARPQADSEYVLVKANKLVRTAGKPRPANQVGALTGLLV